MVADGQSPDPLPDHGGLPGRGVRRAQGDAGQGGLGPQGIPGPLQPGPGRPVRLHVLRVLPGGQRGELQPPVSGRRLLRQTWRHQDAERLLVVLLFQIRGAGRHGAVHTAEEERADQLSARVSPRHHDSFLVDGGGLHSRRTVLLPPLTEHVYPRADVHVLRPGRRGPTHAALPMVEEIPDFHAVAAVRTDQCAHQLQPAVRTHLPLPKELGDAGLGLRPHPHRALRQLLPPGLRQEAAAAAAAAGSREAEGGRGVGTGDVPTQRGGPQPRQGRLTSSSRVSWKGSGQDHRLGTWNLTL